MYILSILYIFKNTLQGKLMLKANYKHFVPQAPENLNYEKFLNYVLITDFEDLKDKLHLENEIVSWDTETSSLSPEEGDIVGFSWSTDGITGYYCPVNHIDCQINGAIEYFVSELKKAKLSLLYNARFDIRMVEWHLKKCGNKEDLSFMRNKFIDVMNAVWIADTNYTLPSLKWATRHFLGYQPPKFLETLGDESNFHYVKVNDAYRYACLEENTSILTENGTKKISEIRVGDLVKSGKNFNKVLALYDNGYRECLSFNYNGICVICTPDHKFAIDTVLGPRWYEAKDLTKKARFYDGKEEIKEFSFNKRSISKSVDVKAFQDFELMYYFLGIAWADAHLQNKEQRFRLDFHQSIKDADHFKNLAKRLGDAELRYRCKGISSSNGGYIRDNGTFDLSFSNRYLVDFLFEHGLDSNKSERSGYKKIPDEYYHHFLRGIFDGDGSSNGNLISFSLHENILDQIKNDISRLYGLKPCKIYRNGKIFNLYYGRKESFYLSRILYDGSSIFLERKKKSVLRKKSRCMVVEKNGEKYYFSGCAEASRKTNLNQSLLSMVALGKRKSTCGYNAYYTRDFFSDLSKPFDNGINLLGCGLKHVYDINVENEHNFTLENNIISHNCLDAINTYNVFKVCQCYHNDAGLAGYLDTQASWIIGHLEETPLKLNTEKIKRIMSDVEKELNEIENTIYELAGEKFNIRSNRELTRIFLKLGIDTGERTKAGDMKTSKVLLGSYLERYPDTSILRKIIDYKETFKFYNSYLKTLVEIGDAQDTRPIRFSYKLQAADTTRLSCCSRDTLIYTDHGIKKIIDLKDGELVDDGTGAFYPAVLLDMGKKQLYELQFSDGTTSHLTEDHKILVIGKNGYVWKEVKDLNINEDKICVKYNNWRKTEVDELFYLLTALSYQSKLVSDKTLIINIVKCGEVLCNKLTSTLTKNNIAFDNFNNRKLTINGKAYDDLVYLLESTYNINAEEDVFKVDRPKLTLVNSLRKAETFLECVYDVKIYKTNLGDSIHCEFISKNPELLSDIKTVMSFAGISSEPIRPVVSKYKKRTDMSDSYLFRTTSAIFYKYMYNSHYRMGIFPSVNPPKFIKDYILNHPVINYRLFRSEAGKRLLSRFQQTPNFNYCMNFNEEFELGMDIFYPITVVSIKPYKVDDTYTLSVDSDKHRYMSDSFISHNCGKDVKNPFFSKLNLQSIPKPKSCKSYGRRATEDEIANKEDLLGWIFSPEHPEWSPGKCVEGMSLNKNIRDAFIPENGSDDYLVSIDMCTEGGSPVYSKRGYIGISELRVGDEILTPNGYKEVIRVINTGKKKVKKISMVGNGQALYCSDDHPIIIDGNTVNAGEIHFKLQQKNDLYAYNENIERQLKCLSVDGRDLKESGISHSMFYNNIFEECTPTSAYLLGYISGAGCLEEDTNGHFNLVISSTDLNHISRIASIFGIITEIEVSNKSDITSYLISIADQDICKSIMDLGKYLTSKDVPSDWLGNNYTHFLRGLFDSSYSVSLTNESELEIGFDKTAVGNTLGNEYNYLSCFVTENSKVKNKHIYEYLYKGATIWLQRKRDVLDEWYIKNFGEIEMEMWDLTIDSEDHIYYLDNILSHNCSEEACIVTNLFREQYFADIINRGGDIHHENSNRIFGAENYTKETRKQSKQALFGMLYGQGERGFQQKFPYMSLEEARDFLDNFKALIPNIVRGQARMTREARKNGTFKTTFGHSIRVKGYLTSSNYKDKAFGERKIKNSPIQSCAAEVLKLEFVRLWDNVFTKYPDVKFHSTIHDEINFSVPRRIASEVIPIMIKCMTVKMENWLVPLNCSLSVGYTMGTLVPFKYDFEKKEFIPDWEELIEKSDTKEEDDECLDDIEDDYDDSDFEI